MESGIFFKSFRRRQRGRANFQSLLVEAAHPLGQVVLQSARGRLASSFRKRPEQQQQQCLRCATRSSQAIRGESGERGSGRAADSHISLSLSDVVALPSPRLAPAIVSSFVRDEVQGGGEQPVSRLTSRVDSQWPLTFRSGTSWRTTSTSRTSASSSRPSRMLMQMQVARWTWRSSYMLSKTRSTSGTWTTQKTTCVPSFRRYAHALLGCPSRCVSPRAFRERDHWQLSIVISRRPLELFMYRPRSCIVLIITPSSNRSTPIATTPSTGTSSQATCCSRTRWRRFSGRTSC